MMNEMFSFFFYEYVQNIPIHIWINMNNNNVKTEEFSFVKKDRCSRNEIFIIERALSIEFSRQIFLGL